MGREWLPYGRSPAERPQGTKTDLGRVCTLARKVLAQERARALRARWPRALKAKRRAEVRR